MFNRFNNGYQDMGNSNMNMNGYQTMPQNPYPTYNADPNIPYPTPPAQMSSPAVFGNYDTSNYAHGGKVQRSRHNWAKKLRKMGTNGDTDLVHVNPLEKRMLKGMGGSGTINPKTGLRQYSFWSNPGKATKSFFTKPKRALAETVGLGSAIFGGPLGGALGGAAKEAILGRSNNMLSGALSGGLQGALIPGAARLAGSGLNSLGANSLGGALQNYGTSNMGSWMGNLGQAGGGISGLWDSLGGVFGSGTEASAAAGAAPTALSAVAGAGKKGSKISGVSAGDDYEDSSKGKDAEEKGFLDKLLDNTSNYLTKPKNLLTLASVASSFANRPKKEKPKTPEQIADEQKRLEKALMLTPEERKAKEADLLAEARMRRSIARNQFLPEERLGNLDPLYRKSHTPEEQKKYGRWFSYYNNPNFSGEPLPFKKGGSVRSELVNKAKKLTAEIIEQNKNQNNGLLEEKSLIRAFSELDKTLGLTSEEKDAVERYAENMFRDIQFTDGPGYFYNQAHGSPLAMKMGGSQETSYPSIGNYIMGHSKGQDDDVNAKLSTGEFVIPADIVADLGDGNNSAGAKELYKFMKNIRKHKRGGAVKLPPKAKSLANYLK